MRGMATAAILAAVGGLCWPAVAEIKDKDKPALPREDLTDRVKRGEYLVHRVARCGECHTPRNDKGELDNDRMLQGAKIWFTPNTPMPRWGDKAPNITSTGKGRWDDEKWIKLLTGQKDDPPTPPMPVFRMTEEDARAVAAYLRTVPGPKRD